MKLTFKPVVERIDLVAPSVWRAIKERQDTATINDILVAEIDPQYMGGAELCEHYGIPERKGANCVVVEAVRGSEKTVVACVVPVNCNA